MQLDNNKSIEVNKSVSQTPNTKQVSNYVNSFRYQDKNKKIELKSE